MLQGDQPSNQLLPQDHRNVRVPQHVVIVDVGGVVGEGVAGYDFWVVGSDFGMEFEPLVGTIICKAAVSAGFGEGVARGEGMVSEVDAKATD